MGAQNKKLECCYGRSVGSVEGQQRVDESLGLKAYRFLASLDACFLDALLRALKLRALNMALVSAGESQAPSRLNFR